MTLWLMWSSGASGAWWRALELALPSPIASLLSYVGLVEACVLVLTLPFSWYRGHRLAREYGLSRQMFRSWLLDWLKASGVGLVLTCLAGLVFYASAALMGRGWWLGFGTVAGAALVVLTFLTPYVLVPLFYRMRPLQEPTVNAAIRRLSLAAGAGVQGVYVLDFSRKTVEANAAVVGLGRSRRVVLADTLLADFEPLEIEAVVAHELGHHIHRDILRLLAVQAGLLWAGLGLAAVAVEPLLSRLGASGGLADPANLPLLLLCAELYGLVSLPFANLFSRRLEAAADRFALRLTGDSAALASALRKLANQNLVEEEPPRWAEIVLSSHPAIGRRIEAAEATERARAA